MAKLNSKWLKRLGPGLITGAADDDPSGIATYSQAGAAFRFDTLWSLLLCFPLMFAIQAICARIGRTTGSGLASLLKGHYQGFWFYIVILPMFVANMINVGADLAAMGDSMALLTHSEERLWFVSGFGVFCTLGMVLMPYPRYCSILKWLTLTLFAYVAVVLIIKVPWLAVLKTTVLPPLRWENKYLTTIVAILGTTISPYLFFWQSSQEVEEIHLHPEREPLIEAPHQHPDAFARIRSDTLTGMAFSTLIAYCIMVATACTLHQHGVTDIKTTAQAAEALRPVAGTFAFALFACGIIGTGLLGVPVLAASAAYGIAGSLGWPNSLSHRAREAKRFYGLIVGAIAIGVLMNLIHIDPMAALFWSAVINGVVAVPAMIAIMLIATNRKVMGIFPIPGHLAVLGWAGTAVMLVAVIAMFVFMLK
ncbi:NRAMP family divalent metal transporter [Silvimonas iriomotensis]|uniref:Iron transporter n=1 Tax=Silvimonas iriomotensis TaxID=449662 RepID=A0ABQ2P5T5_9NEIS|nr:divalent metal cation transporter [Silvimonas iriomotensis]GGP18901.1 iron transporter [Silvimonas iriomotensis]